MGEDAPVTHGVVHIDVNSLNQGPQLLPLWMGEDAHVTGTLDTNVYDDRAILLQLNLPDFDAQLVFPSVITRDSW